MCAITRFLLGCLIVGTLATAPGRAAEAAATSDFTPAMVERLGLPPDYRPHFVLIAAGTDRHYTAEQAKANGLNLLEFAGCHVGGQRLLLRTTFASPALFAGRTYIVYADLDNDPKTGRQDGDNAGVDLMVTVQGDRVGLALHNPAFTAANTLARGIVSGNVLYIALDAPLLTTPTTVSARLYLLSERRGGRADSTPRSVAELPRSELAVPALKGGTGSSLRSVDDYRYHDRFVVLEKLSDKGLAGAQVTPAEPIQIGRPVPRPPFAAASQRPGQAAAVARQQVRLELLEEAGVARTAAPVSCGVPFPRAVLYDLSQMRLLAAAGEELPAQFTATGFWPDGSLKWVLVDVATPLAAGEKRDLVLEFGSDVRRQADRSPLRATEDTATLTIVTGPLQIVLDKQHFNLFRSVWLDGNGDGTFAAAEQVAASGPEGVALLDEQERPFNLSGVAPESLVIEERGPQKLTVRVEGNYADAGGATYMRYSARLTFRAGSPCVTLALTHVDDDLRNEFSDITALTLPLVPTGGVKQATIFLRAEDGALKAYEGPALSLFQSDEKSSALRVGEATVAGQRAPGLVRCRGSAGALTVVAHEFWQRWPKGLAATADQVTLAILPRQPGDDYGKGLPHYLLYPFVEGKYRFKWGMSFTTRITFDFAGARSPEEMLAEANLPVLATVPAAWYAETKALGPLAAPLEQQFAAWDGVVERSYKGFVAERDRDRAYGYFNYGDWYGERERNWGNNEYDFGHGFFMQFARTGNRDYFRVALAAARHEADVDCVHAYPDPYYRGANHLHSIGHTGMWSEQAEYGTWSWPYDYHTAAASGHVWADGMVDAWCLSGEARVMEGALGLAEHVAWALSRDFKQLGTHERSAGWSLRAVMAVYKQTYDKEYLAAAQRIAAVALREQKLDQGGAWPHVLPRDHAGDHPGGVGNNLFLMGILLGGLQAYQEEAQDPAVLAALRAGVGWVARSWDETALGWPYSALADGTPCYRPSTGLNCLIAGPLAYVGQTTADEGLMRIAELALTGVVFGGADTSGKSIAQKMFFTSGTLALLQQWYAAHRPDRGAGVLDGSDGSMAVFMARTADADRHAARTPDLKTFYVKLLAPASELLAERRPHGSMVKRADTGTITVTDAAGSVLKEGSFSTDTGHEFRCPLAGEVGAQFKVVINDDQRGVWTVRGNDLGIVVQTVPDFTIGGVGRSKLHFFVPAGTKEFKLKLLGVHSGAYGAVVLSPAGKPAASHQDVNQGGAVLSRGTVPDTDPAPERHPERGEAVVKPAPADTGKMWSVVLWAAIDIGIELEGVPPFLALTEKAWFEPR